MIKLSRRQAQNMMLAAQGLLKRPEQPATKAAVLETIRRMNLLQIDTIHVVARSPYLVLWSRLGDYEQRWLDELLAEGALFEYWAHEACFIPIEDYPLFRSFMGNRRFYPRTSRWIETHQAEIEHLLSHIRTNGPVRSADFVRTDGKGGGWWDRKPEKVALEMLYTAGELMIARRHNFQRIYDLRERVLPGWNTTEPLSVEEVRRAYVLKTVRALGITQDKWIADYYRTKKTETQPIIKALANEGALVQVEVEGWKTPGYIHPDNLSLVEEAAGDKLEPELTTLLSPFDPLVWDRTRASELFSFDYRIECYTPAPKRRYGYFTLPILHRGELVGRLDPKAHRQNKIFEVKALHLEPGLAITDELVVGIAGALQECAIWHRTPEVVIRHSDPPEFGPLLQKVLGDKAEVVNH